MLLGLNSALGKTEMATALELHAEELKRLAIALTQSAAAEMPDWECVFYEMCRAIRGGSGMSRTIVKNSERRADFHPNSEVSTCCTTLGELRTKLPGEPWYCLSMQVTRDGQVDVQYGYDPHWQNRFFDDFVQHRPF